MVPVSTGLHTLQCSVASAFDSEERNGLPSYAQCLHLFLQLAADPKEGKWRKEVVAISI